MGNVSHKQEGIAKKKEIKCNGELMITLAAIVFALIMVAKQWEQDRRWNAEKPSGTIDP